MAMKNASRFEILSEDINQNAHLSYSISQSRGRMYLNKSKGLPRSKHFNSKVLTLSKHRMAYDTAWTVKADVFRIIDEIIVCRNPCNPRLI